VGAEEIEAGKTFALLSYVLSLVGLPFFLVPLIMRDNAFSLYHAKQCMMIWLVAFVGATICGALGLICCVGVVLALALVVFCVVLEIMGIINAAAGEMKPLPIIGGWGEEWFKGITKV